MPDDIEAATSARSPGAVVLRRLAEREIAYFTACRAKAPETYDWIDVTRPWRWASRSVGAPNSPMLFFTLQ